MDIKAADVMKLRQMTGAGMMDCKKALIEAEGDYARAQEIIREKGKLVAAKRADRETTEGAVVARIDGTKAIILCLGCETDFVSKNAEFQALANAVADTAIKNLPADAEALKACALADGRTVEAAITEQTGKTGEKHVLVGYEKIEAPFIVSYIHAINGKLGALVGFNKEVPADLAKGVAMQVASMNPVAINKDSVPQNVIDNELTVAVEKTKEELVQKAVNSALEKAGINPAHVDSEDHIASNTAKGWLTPEQADQAREIIKTVSAEKSANLPEAMINNIANGRLNKFFKENTQQYRQRPSEQVLQGEHPRGAGISDGRWQDFRKGSYRSGRQGGEGHCLQEILSQRLNSEHNTDKRQGLSALPFFYCRQPSLSPPQGSPGPLFTSFMELCAETSSDRRLCARTLQYTLSVASSVRRDACRMTPLRIKSV